MVRPTVFPDRQTCKVGNINTETRADGFAEEKQTFVCV